MLESEVKKCEEIIKKIKKWKFYFIISDKISALENKLKDGKFLTFDEFENELLGIKISESLPKDTSETFAEALDITYKSNAENIIRYEKGKELDLADLILYSNKVTKQLRKLEKNIEKLEKDKQYLELKINNLEATNKNLNQQNKNLTKEIEDQNDFYETKIKYIMDDNENLTSENDALTSENEALKKTISELKQKNNPRVDIP